MLFLCSSRPIFLCMTCSLQKCCGRTYKTTCCAARMHVPFWIEFPASSRSQNVNIYINVSFKNTNLKGFDHFRPSCFTRLKCEGGFPKTAACLSPWTIGNNPYTAPETRMIRSPSWWLQHLTKPSKKKNIYSKEEHKSTLPTGRQDMQFFKVKSLQKSGRSSGSFTGYSGEISSNLCTHLILVVLVVVVARRFWWICLISSQLKNMCQKKGSSSSSIGVEWTLKMLENSNYTLPHSYSCIAAFLVLLTFPCWSNFQLIVFNFSLEPA